jgi:CheY-like chemotaxis protein
VQYRVLVVEDYKTTRRGIVEALRDDGLLPVEAANGLEALIYLSDGGLAEAIVLDLMMPAMDGWQFRRAQLRDPRLADIPVIVLSALEGRPLGGLAAAAALRKPIDLRLLVETVRAVCARTSRIRRQRLPFP